MIKKLLVSALPVFALHALSAQNFTANLSLDKIHVEENVPVEFEFEDAKDASYWQWEFEGGSPSASTLKKPIVYYEKHGTYPVKLSYGDINGKKTIEKDSYSHIYKVLSNHILNYPLPGDTVVYEDPAGGYVTGNNDKGTLAYANKFDNSFDLGMAVEFISYWFGIANGAGNSNIKMLVWDVNPLGKPGNVISGIDHSFSTIKADVLAEKMSGVDFTWTQTNGNEFFAGFFLPVNGIETLAIISNKDGDTNPGIAWELLADSTWVPMNDPLSSRGINISLAIFPYMIYYINNIPRESNNRNFHPYPNPATDFINFTSSEKVERVEILDSSGRKLMETKHMQVNVSHLSPGIYFSRVVTENGGKVEKFVKN